MEANHSLVQIERALVSGTSSMGAEAILGFSEHLAWLSSSNEIHDIVESELALLFNGDSTRSRWNGRELVLSANPGWSLALARYEPGTVDHAYSLPNIGCFSLVTGSAAIERYKLPEGFDPSVFDADLRLGKPSVEILRPHRPFVIDGRRHALAIRVDEPCVMLRLFSGYVADFQWQFDAISGRPLSIGIARPGDTELESMIATLAALQCQSSVPLLVRLYGHRNHTIRWNAIRALSRIDPLAAMERLRLAATDCHPEVRTAAIKTLQRTNIRNRQHGANA